MTVEDKIDDKELKDINPQRDDYEDEIIQIIKSDEPAYKKIWKPNWELLIRRKKNWMIIMRMI